MQIAGSSAIVVGGAGGLGEATVRRLHGAGAKVVVADMADDKGKALESELGVRYVRTDATSEDSVNAAIAEAASLAPLRISVDTHGGPASGGRLIGKDGSPLDLDGFKKTIEFYLTAVFNVMRLSAAAIAKSEPLDEGARGVIVNTASIAGIRGPDRPTPLLGRQGRRARHDARRGARPVTARHPRGHHRPGHDQHPGLRQGRPTSSSSTGVRRCRSPSGWAGRRSTRSWLRASSKTTTSTARSFAWTAPSASHPSNLLCASVRVCTRHAAQ